MAGFETRRVSQPQGGRLPERHHRRFTKCDVGDPDSVGAVCRFEAGPAISSSTAPSPGTRSAAPGGAAAVKTRGIDIAAVVISSRSPGASSNLSTRRKISVAPGRVTTADQTTSPAADPVGYGCGDSMTVGSTVPYRAASQSRQSAGTAAAVSRSSDKTSPYASHDCAEGCREAPASASRRRSDPAGVKGASLFAGSINVLCRERSRLRLRKTPASQTKPLRRDEDGPGRGSRVGVAFAPCDRPETAASCGSLRAPLRDGGRQDTDPFEPDADREPSAFVPLRGVGVASGLLARYGVPTTRK